MLMLTDELLAGGGDDDDDEEEEDENDDSRLGALSMVRISRTNRCRKSIEEHGRVSKTEDDDDKEDKKGRDN